MDYFEPIKLKQHPQKDVFAKGYFNQLNRVRIDVKHLGIYPDPRDWARVAETTHGYVNKWCLDYLGISLDSLDLSELLSSDSVRQQYAEAREEFENGDYKGTLEKLALGLHGALKENAALRQLKVGKPLAEDAIRLSGFGVHGNEFLALQEFLPDVEQDRAGHLSVHWPKHKGHPGNWREDAGRFCLRTFVDIVLKIQGAPWIPGAIDCDVVYDYKVTALHDGVEVFKSFIIQKDTEKPLQGLDLLRMWSGQEVKRETETVRVLNTGDSLTGWATFHRASESTLLGSGGPEETITIFATDPIDEIGTVYIKDVRVTRVPKPDWADILPNLPEFDWSFD